MQDDNQPSGSPTATPEFAGAKQAKLSTSDKKVIKPSEDFVKAVEAKQALDPSALNPAATAQQISDPATVQPASIPPPVEIAELPSNPQTPPPEQPITANQVLATNIEPLQAVEQTQAPTGTAINSYLGNKWILIIIGFLVGIVVASIFFAFK